MSDAPLERRLHARIQTTVAVELRRGPTKTPASLEDVSRSGARVILAAPQGVERGERIRIAVELGAEGEALLEGEVAHVEARQGGELLGLRFRPSGALDTLLGQLLLSARDARRARVRIVRRVHVVVAGQPGILENLSDGGMSISLPAPVPVGSELDVTLPGVGDAEFTVRARVVHARERPFQPSAHRHLFGLQLLQVSDMSRVALEELIDLLAA